MKKVLKIVKILYLRKEALPELFTIIFVLGALMAVPMYYSRIVKSDFGSLRICGRHSCSGYVGHQSCEEK